MFEPLHLPTHPFSRPFPHDKRVCTCATAALSILRSSPQTKVAKKKKKRSSRVIFLILLVPGAHLAVRAGERAGRNERVRGAESELVRGSPHISSSCAPRAHDGRECRLTCGWDFHSLPLSRLRIISSPVSQCERAFRKGWDRQIVLCRCLLIGRTSS